MLKERLNDNQIDFTKDNFENELSKHVTRGLMAIAANKNILNYNKNNKDISGNQIRNSYILFKSYFNFLLGWKKLYESLRYNAFIGVMSIISY